MRITVLWTLFFPRDCLFTTALPKVYERVFLSFVSLDLSVVFAVRLHGLNCKLFVFPNKPILLKKYLAVYLFNVNRVTYQWTEYLNWKEDLYWNDWKILIWIKFTYFLLIAAKRDICQSGVGKVMTLPYDAMEMMSHKQQRYLDASLLILCPRLILRQKRTFFLPFFESDGLW